MTRVAAIQIHLKLPVLSTCIHQMIENLVW